MKCTKILLTLIVMSILFSSFTYALFFPILGITDSNVYYDRTWWINESRGDLVDQSGYLEVNSTWVALYGSSFTYSDYFDQDLNTTSNVVFANILNETEVLALNGTWSDVDTDTNASTACNSNEYLDGDGVCVELVESVSSADDYIIVNSSTGAVEIDFNESKFEVTYYNASSVEVVTGTASGSLALIQEYDLITYNITEVNSDFELIVNFTGVEDFTSLIVRHKTDVDAGHLSIIQIWDYNSSLWEGYGHLIESTTAEIQTLGVYDSSDHIKDGIVQVRFYQVEVGNSGHIHQFDWVAISKGFGTPVGEEIDPYSVHRDGNTPLTANWGQGAYNLTNTDSWWLGKINWSVIQNSPSYALISNLVSLVGNWSADKSSYYTSAQDDSMGNWTGDKSTYQIWTTTKAYIDSIGNWTAVSSTYQIWTTTKAYIDSIGNWTSDKSGYQIWVTTKAYIDSIGNWTADKGDYYTSAQTDTAITNTNTSQTTYIDAQDLSYNNSQTTYIDAQNIVFNDSQKTYGDANYLDDTNTEYTNQSPISLSGTTFGLINCSDNEIWKMDGASWTCEADDAGAGAYTFNLTGDTGTEQVIDTTNTVDIAGGTNGIDTVVGATDTVTINFDWTEVAADAISEAKIDMDTSCAAGNHLYVNGNDLACEADDDTTYTCYDWTACSDDSLWDADKLDGEDGAYYLDNTDTNASTACAVNEYLDGEGNCVDVITEAELDTFSELDTQIADSIIVNQTYGNATYLDNSDTNASTECAGTTTYLDGEGNCDDISGVYVQAASWATIDNYPSGCAANHYVQAIGDTLTCVNIVNDTDTDTQLTQAEVEDYAGGLWTGNTEDGVDVVYQGGDNTADITFDCSDVAGAGLGCTGEDLIHNDSSSQASIDNSVITFIQDLVLDTFGHITGSTSAAIPTATPSDDDTTHLSTADQIYDWVIGLSYSTTVGTVTSVTGAAPITSTEGTTPEIALTLAKDIVAGDGMTGGEDDVLPGANADTTVTLGTPTSNTGSTSNAVTATSHTHAITSDDTGACSAGVICGGGHGHPARQITTGTFGTGSYVIDTDLTVESIKFEVDSTNHYIEDNGSCMIFHGDTTNFNLC